jgi:AraC-like DNA-binding protein
MIEARDLVLARMDDPPSLAELAHQVGTNEFVLKRDFKAFFGNTVYGLLLEHKLAYARALLLDTDRAIGEIAREVGYSHAANFRTAFKKTNRRLVTEKKPYLLTCWNQGCTVGILFHQDAPPPVAVTVDLGNHPVEQNILLCSIYRGRACTPKHQKRCSEEQGATVFHGLASTCFMLLNGMDWYLA